MNLAVVQRILGILLIAFSGTMLIPMSLSFLFDDGSWVAFLDAFGVILVAGLIIWLPVRKQRAEMKIRDGFLIVSAFWVGLGTAGAIPLWMSEVPYMSFPDAVFESVSGLTTTGATVLVGLDTLPPAILFYRHQLQWLGGMGIIVLAVAVLPILGVGGMQLYRAETPGPVKDTKLTPRITQTARALWYIYLSMTIACAVGYRLAGMGWFDAICHSFSTVAIGGFSTHDASLGYFHSYWVNVVAIVFMFAAGINFSLHFIAVRRLLPDVRVQFRHARPDVEWKGRRRISVRGALESFTLDPEFRAYVGALTFATLITVGYLLWLGHYESTPDALVHGMFQAVSIGTTTGFSTDTFSAWPGALPLLLLLSSFVGGCAGSTGGGMKVIRWLLLIKQGLRELTRLLHPSAEIPVRVGERAVPVRVIEAVWGFFATYVVVFATLMTALMMFGLDQVTAFSAIAASLNNLGPGLGDVAANYGGIPDAAKWICVLAMVLGRLEIFTLMVLITPEFWRDAGHRRNSRASPAWD